MTDSSAELTVFKTITTEAWYAELENAKSTADEDSRGLPSESACVICYEREGDHVLLPCGHGGYCGGCAHTLLKHPPPSRLCPVCRAQLGGIAKVHLGTPIGTEGEVLEASVGGPVVTDAHSANM